MLQCYHKALTIHDEARAKDALNLLQRMLDLRGPTVKEDDLTEMWLKEMYSGKEPHTMILKANVNTFSIILFCSVGVEFTCVVQTSFRQMTPHERTC